MKRIEFETSKGKFLLMDGVGEDFAMDLTHKIISKEWFVRLSEITEDEASEIVEYAGSPWIGYEDYSNKQNWFKTAIDSLQSLIKSKCVHLFKNPEGISYSKMPDAGMDYRSFLSWQEAESNTFYNPYIFKI